MAKTSTCYNQNEQSKGKGFETKLKEIEKVNFHHPNNRIGGCRIKYPAERLNKVSFKLLKKLTL
jgi:hypothetical protein